MIGLVGGLGVGAAIHYYRELAAAHEQRGLPLELVMSHAQMSRIFEHSSSGDLTGLANYLAGILSRMKAAGATVGVIPALTPHICIDQLLPITPLPLVNLLDVVRAELASRHLTSVALFGTRFVIESDLFGRLAGINVVRPAPGEITFIHETYTQLARAGTVPPDQHQRLIELAERLVSRGADAVVLAGTDFSLLFTEGATPFPHLDCARAHIRAIMPA